MESDIYFTLACGIKPKAPCSVTLSSEALCVDYSCRIHISIRGLQTPFTSLWLLFIGFFLNHVEPLKLSSL